MLDECAKLCGSVLPVDCLRGQTSLYQHSSDVVCDIVEYR